MAYISCMTNSMRAWFIFGINTIQTSFGYLNPQNGTDTLLVHRAIWKTPWNSWPPTMIRLQSSLLLPFLLVILYPCFLIYFSEAPLTLPRCVSVSLAEKCGENVSRSEEEKGERNQEDKRESVILTSACFTFKRIFNLTQFSFNCSRWRQRMAAIQKAAR